MSEIPITTPILDKLGRVIIPGMYIIYGHALSQCAALRLGKVLKITGIIKPAFSNYPERREYRITVRGLDDDSFDANEPDRADWRGEKYRPKLLEKKSTLQYPDRVIVVPDNDVPLSIRELFADVK